MELVEDKWLWWKLDREVQQELTLIAEWTVGVLFVLAEWADAGSAE